MISMTELNTGQGAIASLGIQFFLLSYIYIRFKNQAWPLSN
jgi:hypothetical protein